MQTLAGANIVSLDQHATAQAGGTFMQRTIFHLPGLAAARDALERAFTEQVATPFDIDFRLTEACKPKRVAIMASKEDHCLLDLLWRNRRGELDMSVVMVIANHADLADQVRPFGVPFIHIPATKDIREEAERRQLDLLRGNVDLVVLARYMQIVTPHFLSEVGCPMINIHHSFLPAFIGAAPYRRAKERGVKLVGATAHYVTDDLDEGPIIEQDVNRVSHSDSVDELTRKGFDVVTAALPQVQEAVPGVRVLAMGRGDGEAALGGLAPSVRSAVELLGALPDDDKAALLRSADVFVAPQTGGESFGIVLLEAMSAGAPMVASDLGAFRRVLDGGRLGELVPPGDADALARAVIGLLGDPDRRAELAEAGRHAVRRYDWSRVAAEVLEVYETVRLGRAPTGARR